MYDDLKLTVNGKKVEFSNTIRTGKPGYVVYEDEWQLVEPSKPGSARQNFIARSGSIVLRWVAA